MHPSCGFDSGAERKPCQRGHPCVRVPRLSAWGVVATVASNRDNSATDAILRGMFAADVSLCRPFIDVPGISVPSAILAELRRD